MHFYLVYKNWWGLKLFRSANYMLVLLIHDSMYWHKISTSCKSCWWGWNYFLSSLLKCVLDADLLISSQEDTLVTFREDFSFMLLKTDQVEWRIRAKRVPNMSQFSPVTPSHIIIVWVWENLKYFAYDRPGRLELQATDQITTKTPVSMTIQTESLTAISDTIDCLIDCKNRSITDSFGSRSV